MIVQNSNPRSDRIVNLVEKLYYKCSAHGRWEAALGEACRLAVSVSPTWFTFITSIQQSSPSSLRQQASQPAAAAQLWVINSFLNVFFLSNRPENEHSIKLPLTRNTSEFQVSTFWSYFPLYVDKLTKKEKLLMCFLSVRPQLSVHYSASRSQASGTV